MSETEFSRLAAQLSEIAIDIGIMKERLLTYPDNVAMILKHDKEIELMKQRCQAVQSAKDSTSLPWGSVKGAILGGVVVGIVMMIINLVIRYAN